MFHVLLPLIAILPGLLILAVIGLLLIGLALFVAGIITLIVRAARKSQKKGSLIAGIIMLAIGGLALAPIGLGVIAVMRSDLPNAIDSSRNDEDIDNLPLFEVSGKGNTRFMYNGEVLVPVHFKLAGDKKKFYQMKPVAQIDFKDDLVSRFILFRGTLKNGCDYYAIQGLPDSSYVLASELEEVQASYDIEVLDSDY